MKKFWFALVSVLAVLALVVTPALAWEPLFSDDFESGGFSSWGAANTVGNATLMIRSDQCPYVTHDGYFCVQAVTNAAQAESWLADSTPANEDKYHATWYGNVSGGSESSIQNIFVGYMNYGPWNQDVFSVQVSKISGVLKARIQCQSNSFNAENGTWLNIPDAEGYPDSALFSVAFRRGTSTTEGSCTLRMYNLNTGAVTSEVVYQQMNELDVDFVRLGVPNTDSSATFTHWFDVFESFNE